MSHLHVPDGILPWWLVLGGWAVLALVLSFILPQTRGLSAIRRLPRLGFLAAFMALTMSLEILPLAYHFNMSVFTGILLGPAVGFLAGLIVVIFLALSGHGGVSVIALNALFIGTEIVLGSLLYSLLRRTRCPPVPAAFVATVLSLAAGTSLMVATVWLGGVVPSHTHHGQAPSSFHTFEIVVYGFGAIGWAIEAFLTAAMIRYLAKVRPRLLALP